jgi:hypothetical protein
MQKYFPLGRNAAQVFVTRGLRLPLSGTELRWDSVFRTGVARTSPSGAPLAFTDDSADQKTAGDL